MSLTLSSRELALLDALPTPVAVCATSGQLLHESPALRRLLVEEPLAAAVRSAIADAARALVRRPAADGAPSVHEARGARLRYELRGAVLAHPVTAAGRAAVAIFLVYAAPPRAPSDAELRERFALTAREIEVLRLLAVGRSAREVSSSLGLSYYTARHHVEHVLAKLGVHTRAAVAEVTGRQGA